MKQRLSVVLLAGLLSGCIDSNGLEQYFNERPQQTPIITEYLDNWQKKIEEHQIPNGIYTTVEARTVSGGFMRISESYIFENGNLFYEAEIKGKRFLFFPFEYYLSGKANYIDENGLLSFSHVVGRGVAFPLYSIPFEVINDGQEIILYEMNDDGREGITILTKKK